MVKCVYAGDPNDEYCKNCNGILMLVDGEEYPCTECTAYTAGDDEDNTEQAANENEAAVADEPVNSQDAHTDDLEQETTNSTQDVAEQATDEASCADERPVVTETIHSAEEETSIDGVTVKALRYMSGVTVAKTESNGNITYYKFNAEEEWDIDDAVGKDADKVNSIREALWDKLNLEIDSQIEEIYQ